MNVGDRHQVQAGRLNGREIFHNSLKQDPVSTMPILNCGHLEEVEEFIASPFGRSCPQMVERRRFTG